MIVLSVDLSRIYVQVHNLNVNVDAYTLIPLHRYSQIVVQEGTVLDLSQHGLVGPLEYMVPHLFVYSLLFTEGEFSYNMAGTLFQL